MPIRAVLELQHYLNVDRALVAVVDAVLDVLAPDIAARDPSALALRTALEPRNVPFWELGAHASTLLRVTTSYEDRVEHNYYTQEDVDRSTYTFAVATVAGELVVESASGSMTASLRVTASELLFEDLRHALLTRAATWLPKPRIAAHPSAPDAWLARATTLGLAWRGMEVSREHNASGTALWHADRGAWFGTLYAANAGVLYALGPRPPLASVARYHKSDPESPPRLDELRARISELLGVQGTEQLEQSGLSTRVLGAAANPSFSIAYFDTESFHGDFSWTRSRTRDGWLLTAERADPAKPQPMVELVWIDAQSRYFVRVAYQYFDGHRLEAMFVGEHAEALQAMMAKYA